MWSKITLNLKQQEGEESEKRRRRRLHKILSIGIALEGKQKAM